MNPKGMLLALALTVAGTGLLSLTAEAQLNVVGYYNISITNGYNFVGVQLRATAKQRLSDVVPSPPEGTVAFVWDVPAQAYFSPATFSGGWDTNYPLPVGRGFVIYSQAQWTLTIVGDVLQGSLVNFVANFSLLTSMVPVAGAISSDLRYPGGDGDLVYFFRRGTPTFTDACTYVTNYGWFDPKGVSGTGGPTNNVGDAFFVQNPGADKNWQLNYAVPFASTATSQRVNGAVAKTSIRKISLSRGKVTLEINNPKKSLYNVQFSTDSVSWKTVANDQTVKIWTGPDPGGYRGFFQVVNP
jgi:hypothetical protein